jgi:hypothetical protein
MNRFKNFSQFLNEEYNYENKNLLSKEQIKFMNSGCGSQNEWKVNERGEVFVSGDFQIIDNDIEEIPVVFNTVTTHFDISGDKLKSLKGFPKIIGGKLTLFQCGNIENLEGPVEKVYGNISIAYCRNIKNLKGFPETEPDVTLRIMNCNSFRSFEGLPPDVKLDWIILANLVLPNLEGLPREISGGLKIEGVNGIKDLKGCPQKIGTNFILRDCAALNTTEGGPTEIGADWEINVPQLKELKNGVKVGRDVSLYGNYAVPELSTIREEGLLKMWLESNLTPEEFMHKKRGTIKGREFGF